MPIFIKVVLWILCSGIAIGLILGFISTWTPWDVLYMIQNSKWMVKNDDIRS